MSKILSNKFRTLLELMQPEPISILFYDDKEWNINNLGDTQICRYSSDELHDYLNDFSKEWQNVIKSTLDLEKSEKLDSLEWIFIGNNSISKQDVNSQAEVLKKKFLNHVKSVEQLVNNSNIVNSPQDELKLFKEEGYILNFTNFGIYILTENAHGCFNGLQTVLNIIDIIKLENIQSSEPFQILDHPKLAIRAFHLDLKDLMPTFEYIKDFIMFLARYKTNYICIEYEDKYPYKEYLAPVIHRYAWSIEQFHEIKKLCKSYFIEIMPLIQIFGHVEKHLQKKEFKHLMETISGEPIEIGAYESWSLCPLHDDATKFAFSFVDQIIEGHPESKYIHIGADEVYQLGTCPKCKDYLKNHTKSELYINHINKVANRVLEQGKIPVMWHDYLLKYPDNLDLLNKDIVVMYWIYKTWRKEKNEDDMKNILPHFDFFHDRGYKTMGAPSVSSDFDPLIPNYRTRLENNAGQAARALESGSLGLLNTSWVVCGNPLETQKIAIILSCGMMWAPPLSWDSLRWDDMDKSIQLYYFGIPSKNYTPWLEKFSIATERNNRRWPAKEALQLLPWALESIKNMEKIAERNIITLKSMKFGIEDRNMFSEIIKKISVLMKYANNDGENAEFPTDDTLENNTAFFNSISNRFVGIVERAKKFYIDENKQILPDEFDVIFGLSENSYQRYREHSDFSEVGEAFENVSDSIGNLLMAIFRLDYMP